MAYYYVGYLYKYFSYIIKKERRPQSMKITCNKNELTNALQIVARAVASKPQTPHPLWHLPESRRHDLGTPGHKL